jgi:hypothetical protein
VAGGRRLVALELNGVKQELPHGQEDRVLIAGDRMIADNECFSFKLDPSTDPKLIDLVRLVGRDKGFRCAALPRIVRCWRSTGRTMIIKRFEVTSQRNEQSWVQKGGKPGGGFARKL